ncbi:MAG: nucleotide sugar dehydrogenase, partial [Candidatus Omnitrophica bacterium]|nr:nucleotide sugar dehydrogenase [Candidatus Omnitrophota bacterium]
ELRKVLDLGRFSAGGDFSILNEIDAVIICVPTPLKRKYQPNISYILQAVSAISKNMKSATLVVLESTTYPGTTEEVILPVLESRGARCGEDFYLAFSPERIDPGNIQYPVCKIPKVIGGVTKEATDLTAALYGNIIHKVVPVSSPRAAEIVKLIENTFRIVNIGLIDEIAMMAHKMGIDIWEVIDAAKTKPFGFMPFYPGPGVGGHCIPKDPLYLYWKAKHYGFRSRFIKLASDIVSFMPQYVVQRIEDIFKKRKKSVGKLKVLIIGATYKKDIKDLRKSPSLDIIDIFKKKGTDIHYHDPLIPYLKFNGVNLRSVDLTKDKLSSFDCVVIATDHSAIDYAFILKNSRMIFDARNVYKDIESEKIVRL